MARSLLNCFVEFIARGSKVFSVTSDIQAGTALKTTAPRQSRQDAPQPADSFSALVDAATPDPSTASPPTSASPSPRAGSASTPSREPARAGDADRTTQARSQDKPADKADGSTARDDASGSDTTADATTGTPTKTDAAGTADGKTSDGKTGDKKDGDQASTDASAVTTAVAEQTLTVPTPVAVAIQPETILANPATGDGTADGDGTSNAPGATAPIGASGVGPQGSVDAAAGLLAAAAKSTGAAKDADGAGSTAAAPETAAAASGDAAASADQTFTAALDAAVPGGTKPTGKPGTQTKTGLADGAAGKVTEPGNGDVQAAQQPGHGALAQQPAVAAKPDSVEAGDGKANGNVQAPASHDRNAAPTTSQTNAPAPDPSAQATVAVQPQLSTPAASTSQITSANLTATAATAAAVPLHGLAVEIAASALNGKSRFEIRLDPAELGRIDVRIDVDRNGQVTSHLRVEKPETLAMLQQTAPQLQQALQDAGLKSNNSGLQFSLRDQNSSGQNGGDYQQNGNAQRLIVTEDENVPVQLAGRSYGRMFGAQGGVDIRV
nr:flagellar hook-length control protein FliK [Bradyrhizobium sp. SZCCHNPS1003]